MKITLPFECSMLVLSYSLRAVPRIGSERDYSSSLKSSSYLNLTSVCSGRGIGSEKKRDFSGKMPTIHSSTDNEYSSKIQIFLPSFELSENRRKKKILPIVPFTTL